jgi:2-methylcitrate dehydratase PrpD
MSPAEPDMTVCETLAEWAFHFVPTADDLSLAERSLRDTVAIALAAADEPVVSRARVLGAAGAWAAAAHVLDFDELHVESSAHVSAVIVPVVLATGGDATAFLAGAGVMARLGVVLGWSHYARGWHITCTAGAPAAAVAAAVALGLGEEEIAHAMALAVPAAGGVQRAFGTDAKALQVGMAADAGVRAALLAEKGARADLCALEQWMDLVGAEAATVDTAGPAVPGGLAVKLFPSCYATQRPIHAVRAALGGQRDVAVRSVHVTTPVGTVLPLIHHRPQSGLEGKFSLEYAVAAALLDEWPTPNSFTDEQVRRPAAAAIVETVTTELLPGGEGLLDGTCRVDLHLEDGSVLRADIDQPPGSPKLPATSLELDRKLSSCGPLVQARLDDLQWETAAPILESLIPNGSSA